MIIIITIIITIIIIIIIIITIITIIIFLGEVERLINKVDSKKELYKNMWF